MGRMPRFAVISRLYRLVYLFVVTARSRLAGEIVRERVALGANCTSDYDFGVSKPVLQIET